MSSDYCTRNSSPFMSKAVRRFQQTSLQKLSYKPKVVSRFRSNSFSATRSSDFLEGKIDKPADPYNVTTLKLPSFRDDEGH